MEVHQRKLLRSPSGEGCCWDLSPSVARVSLWAFVSLALLHGLKQHRPEKHSRRWVVDIQSHIKICPPPQTCCISKASGEITESLGDTGQCVGKRIGCPRLQNPALLLTSSAALSMLTFLNCFPTSTVEITQFLFCRAV